MWIGHALAKCSFSSQLLHFLSGGVCHWYRSDIGEQSDISVHNGSKPWAVFSLEVGAMFVISTEGRCIHGWGHPLK
jgi:hypothetical protein